MDFLAFSVNKLNHHYSLQCPWMQSLKISFSRCSTLLGSVFRNVLYFKPSFVLDHPVSWAILWMCLWQKISSCVIWSWVIWSYQTFQLLDLHWALLNAADWVSDLISLARVAFALSYSSPGHSALLLSTCNIFRCIAELHSPGDFHSAQRQCHNNCSKSLQHDLGNSGQLWDHSLHLRSAPTSPDVLSL